MPAERLECDGEPTFSAELRQVGDGLLVRRLQQPPESGLGFSGGQVARSRDGRVRGAGGARQLGEKGAAPRYQGQKIVFGTARR